VRKSFFKFTCLLIGFFAIAILGNVISRTTSLGGLIGLVYMFFNLGLFSFVLKERNIKTYTALITIMVVAFYIGLYFYHRSEDFHRQIRFGFEGFFNWVEKGEWRTDSTDKLNKTMWIWPQDTKTWIIGAGLFDNWAFNTDIGYCRFILYSGLMGFAVFASFFIYNATVFSIKYRDYQHLFILFSILTFTTWLKVSTDIFLIYALFYNMDILTKGEAFSTNDDNDEDRLLYSRNF